MLNIFCRYRYQQLFVFVDINLGILYMENLYFEHKNYGNIYSSNFGKMLSVFFRCVHYENWKHTNVHRIQQCTGTSIMRSRRRCILTLFTFRLLWLCLCSNSIFTFHLIWGCEPKLKRNRAKFYRIAPQIHQTSKVFAMSCQHRAGRCSEMLIVERTTHVCVLVRLHIRCVCRLAID